MTGSHWGLLAPEELPSTRRTRTLGLGRSVRQFNELAVPGLGGVYYGRQVLFTALSVAISKRVKDRDISTTHIDIANAIEAIACIIGYQENGGSAHQRLRGRNKLPRNTKSPDFRTARKRGFYVAQPMRMSTAQALPSLGLVDTSSIRFNAFEGNERLDAFVSDCLEDLTVGKSNVLDHLSYWVAGSKLNWGSAGLVAALNPLTPLPPQARLSLKNALLQGTTLSPELRIRRQRAWQWVSRLRAQPDTVDSLSNATPPPELDEQHWHDLRAGAQLGLVRDSAVSTLDSTERVLESRRTRSLSMDSELPDLIKDCLVTLRSQARAFLALQHDDAEANQFCTECLQGGTDTLRHLLRRDDQVLRLLDDCARPGPAYTGTPPTIVVSVEEDITGEDLSVAPLESVPAGISYRVRNLFRLQQDLEDASQDRSVRFGQEDAI